METSKLRKRMPATTLFDPAIVVPAIGQAFVKLDPRTLVKNPVMFVLEVVTLLTTVTIGARYRDGAADRVRAANRDLAVVHGAVREFRRSRGRGRGKAQADSTA